MKLKKGNLVRIGKYVAEVQYIYMANGSKEIIQTNFDRALTEKVTVTYLEGPNKDRNISFNLSAGFIIPLTMEEEVIFKIINS